MKTITLKDRLKKAFTITELVIVIAVIAILAAILIPTFSKVTESANKSHDVQIVRSINEALKSYTLEHGKAPATYEELMTKVLYDYDLTDDGNPFLLAGALKQEGCYIVWVPNSNEVMLVNEKEDKYLMTFTPNIGLGNGVQLADKTSDTTISIEGFVLCTNGEYNYVADLYKDFFITHGGNINDFVSGGFNEGSVLENVGNEAWANSIIAAIGNQKVGYTHSAKVENKVMEQLSVTSSATIDVSDLVGDVSSEKLDAVKQQTVRSTLATLAVMQNNKTTAASMAGKKITLAGVNNTTVDMTGVRPTAIGVDYRKGPYCRDEKDNKMVSTSTVSVDFGGATLNNFSVPTNKFVAAGSNWQDAGDNGYVKPSYMFTYGLFGSVLAKPGETVTIENLTINDVDMDLNGATEMIDGNKATVLSDQAGIVAGYAQGHVVFRNITINGKTSNTENNAALGKEGRGQFSAYDGVSAVLGRAYENKNASDNLIEMENIDISNLDINGQRRAAAFIGYTSGIKKMSIKDCTVKNVNINVERSDGGTQLMFGLFGDVAAPLDVNNVTFEDCNTSFKFKITAEQAFLDIEGYEALTDEQKESYKGVNSKGAKTTITPSTSYYYAVIDGKRYYVSCNYASDSPNRLNLVGALKIKVGATTYNITKDGNKNVLLAKDASAPAPDAESGK